MHEYWSRSPGRRIRRKRAELSEGRRRRALSGPGQARLADDTYGQSARKVTVPISIAEFTPSMTASHMYELCVSS
jgi:hypothetical protein